MKRNEILSKFEKLEIKLKLDEYKIKNVYWWDCLRFIIYDLILYKKGINQFAYRDIEETYKGNNLIKNIYSLFFIFLNIFNSRSPFRIKKDSLLFFCHPRRKKINDIYVDIYSDPLIDNLKKKYNVSAIENPLNFALYENQEIKHLSPAKTDNLFYSDVLIKLQGLLSKFIAIRFKKSEKLRLGKIESDFEKIFNLKLDFKLYVKNSLSQFLSSYYVYKFLFFIIRPRVIFIVVGNGAEPIIAAAKSQNVTTFEIQHGSPSRGKLNYDYSSGISKKYFSDWFISFGEFWADNIKLPILNDKIINLGYLHLNNYLKNNFKRTKKRNSITVISQPQVSRELFNFTKSLSKLVPKEINVFFKPHPGEILDSDYYESSITNQTNVTILSNDIDIYSFFNKSICVIGVSSTAIYEALAFECKCYILKTDGCEIMKPLIENGLAKLVSTPHQIDLKLKSFSNKFEYMFKKNSTPRLEKLYSIIDL
tara:strand:+ start:6364 stop:7800 length:1437 start_codon:yes stop_codon:yes gene_type:complete